MWIITISNNWARILKINQVCVIVVTPFTEDIFQDPQWMPESSDSTKLYICYVFLCAYIRHSERLITIINIKMEKQNILLLSKIRVTQT